MTSRSIPSPPPWLRSLSQDPCLWVESDLKVNWTPLPPPKAFECKVFVDQIPLDPKCRTQYISFFKPVPKNRIVGVCGSHATTGLIGGKLHIGSRRHHHHLSEDGDPVKPLYSSLLKSDWIWKGLSHRWLRTGSSCLKQTKRWVSAQKWIWF